MYLRTRFMQLSYNYNYEVPFPTYIYLSQKDRGTISYIYMSVFITTMFFIIII